MTSLSIAIVAVAAVRIGDGARQQDTKSVLIVLCDDVTGTRCGIVDIVDKYEDVMSSSSSYPPSTLLLRETLVMIYRMEDRDS